MNESLDRQITVIIPVYNCLNYLEDAVKSVDSQSDGKVNIILVDDGSDDGSTELCDRFAKSYKNLFVIHKKNGGVSSARNVGIEYVIRHMPRSYIAFLDADDAWNRKFYVDNVASLLEQNYDLVGFQSCECDAKMRWRNEPCKLENGIFLGGIKSLWIHATQHFAAMLYSCEFLKKYNIRFDEKIHPELFMSI